MKYFTSSRQSVNYLLELQLNVTRVIILVLIEQWHLHYFSLVPSSLPSLPQLSRMVTLYIQCCQSLKACVVSFSWRSHRQGCDTSCMTTISDFSDHPQMPPFPRVSVTFLSRGPLNISVRPFPNQARWYMMINSALICSDSHPSTCWQRSPSNCC